VGSGVMKMDDSRYFEGKEKAEPKCEFGRCPDLCHKALASKAYSSVWYWSVQSGV
jgi:hypothetical protein